MKIRKKNYIDVGMDRKTAKALLKVVNGNPLLEDVQSQLQEELKDRYEYKVKCSDCTRVFAVELSAEIEGVEPLKGGYCSSCSDDCK